MKDACCRLRKEQRLSRIHEYENIDRSRQVNDKISTISTISTGNNDSARPACGLFTSAEEKKEQQV